MANESIFDEPDQVLVDPEKDYFSEQVGEGRKYKDTMAAGRALVEKDVHIARIEAENALLRETNTKSKSMQELVDQIRTRDNPPAVIPPVTIPDNAADPNPINATKVEDLVRQAVDRRDADKTAAANRAEVTRVLRNQYGPGFKAVVEATLETLGVGQKFVDDLAARSPAAVLKLLGLDAPSRPQNVAQPARANPGSVVGGTRKNFAYFEKLRVANRGGLTASQNEDAVAEAIAQGDAFYR